MVIWDTIRVIWFIVGIFVKMMFIVCVFLPIYVLLCPYAFCDDMAYEDRMNYLNHFEDLM